MAIGQFFSQRFGYAVHAMAFVARKPAGELTTLPEMAEWMRTIWPNSSDSYLSTVVQRLARAKLLRSHRGISGGYSLGRAASKITLRDLVELLEGVDLNRCGLSLEDRCPVKARCSIQRRLRQLEASYLKALEEVTIADLSQDILVQIPNREGN
jgi:Rrf2 family protein